MWEETIRAHFCTSGADVRKSSTSCAGSSGACSYLEEPFKGGLTMSAVSFNGNYFQRCVDEEQPR